MSQKSSILQSYRKQKQIRELHESLPEIFTDDKLDIQKLKAFVGSEQCIDQGNYQLNWFDKAKAVQLAEEECLAEWEHRIEKSVNGSQTKNMLIEGDNLHALKLLEQDYAEKIRLIYLDPPYNTGKNFAYHDRYQMAANDYLAYLDRYQPGYVNSREQNRIESGEIHTRWLNMMYARLLLCKPLLSENGVVAISIDESEKANLQLLCNEIFGEENFVGCFIWVNRSIANDSANMYSAVHEYILVYAKKAENIRFKGEEKDFANYSNPDQDPNGDWMPDNPTAASGNENYRFRIVNPITRQIYMPPNGRYWAFSEARVAEWTKSGKLVFPREVGKRFLLKKYRSELKSELKPISSVITDIPTAMGTRELKKLYPEGLPFKHPKPTDLLVKIFEQLSDEEDVILDPFAGSASTAHAIYKMNEGGVSHRQFICIQNREKVPANSAAAQLGLENICELAADRMVRAGKLYSCEDSGFNYYKIPDIE